MDSRREGSSHEQNNGRAKMTRKFMRYAILTAASGIGLAALSAQTPAG
jgi:hypothetical protein